MLQKKSCFEHICHSRLCFEKISFAFYPCLSLFNKNLNLMPSQVESVSVTFHSKIKGRARKAERFVL